MVIYNMRAKKPEYNLISNNCQNFALLMLDAIHVGAHKEFATSFAVYKSAISGGKVSNLFVDNIPENETDQEPAQVVHHAQEVMEENTTKLDNHRSIF